MTSLSHLNCVITYDLQDEMNIDRGVFRSHPQGPVSPGDADPAFHVVTNAIAPPLGEGPEELSRTSLPPQGDNTIAKGEPGLAQPELAQPEPAQPEPALQNQCRQNQYHLQTGPVALDANQWQQLCEIALDLSLSESYSAALSMLLTRLSQALGWTYGEIWSPPTLARAALCCAEPWYAAEPSEWLSFRQVSQQMPFVPGVGLPGRVWAKQARELLSATQLQLEPLFPRASMLRGLGIQTAIGLPLNQGDQVLGVVVFMGRHAVAETDPSLEWLAYLLDRLTPLLAQKQQREWQLSAESRYRNIFETLAEGVFQTDLEGEYLSVNQRLADIFGYDSPEALIQGPPCSECYVEAQQHQAFVDRLRQSTQVESIEAQVYRRDGRIIWVSECAQALRDASGQIWGYIGTVEDVTDRKQVELELTQRDSCLQGLAEATHILLNQPDLDIAIPLVLAIVVELLNVDRSYLYTAIAPDQVNLLWGSPVLDALSSQAAEPVTDLSEDLATAETAPLRLLFEHHRNQPSPSHRLGDHPQYPPIDWRPWLDSLRDGQSIVEGIETTTGVSPSPSSQNGPGTLIGIPIFIDDLFCGVLGCETHDRKPIWSSSSQSVIAAIAASLGGIFKRQQTEQKIQHQAFHDTLTGLPNRLMFNHRLPNTLARARRTGETLAVMFLDLDRFKTINDSLGHEIGDQLLTLATQRLLSCLRQEDILARWGGDEFTMCLPDLRSSDDVARICQRLLDVMRQPFSIGNHNLRISVSMGIALFPQDGEDLTSLLRSADSALYRVKAAGRDHYCFYSLDLNEQSSRRLTLEQELLSVLTSNQLQLYYQPQIDLRHQRICQWEALLRWHHPQFGVILPAEFLPLAESLGMMPLIGAWVLQQACQQLQSWRQLGYEVSLGVNLSAKQFQSLDLVETLTQILRETEIPSQQLVLEVTESMLIKDIEGAIAILHALRGLGITLALDDFGSGYSSLEDLKRLPISALKIDSQFVHGLPEDADRAIVTAIIALGQGLGLQVIAEGVESSHQLNCLLGMGCTLIQGQLLYGPLTAQAATRLLRSSPSQPLADRSSPPQ